MEATPGEWLCLFPSPRVAKSSQVSIIIDKGSSQQRSGCATTRERRMGASAEMGNATGSIGGQEPAVLGAKCATRRNIEIAQRTQDRRLTRAEVRERTQDCHATGPKARTNPGLSRDRGEIRERTQGRSTNASQDARTNPRLGNLHKLRKLGRLRRLFRHQDRSLASGYGSLESAAGQNPECRVRRKRPTWTFSGKSAPARFAVAPYLFNKCCACC